MRAGLGKVVRVEGIEPSTQAWEAHVLPLNYTRLAALRLGFYMEEGRASMGNPYAWEFVGVESRSDEGRWCLFMDLSGAKALA
jgi:hypothetical protein